MLGDQQAIELAKELLALLWGRGIRDNDRGVFRSVEHRICSLPMLHVKQG